MPGHRSTTGAEALGSACVGDVMSSPIVSCQSDVPLGEVAALMSGHRIHAVVVIGDPARGEDDPHAWRIISEADLLHAVALDTHAVVAGRIAASPLVTVGRDASLLEAALLMSEHETTHIIAVDDGHPVGIVSALDIAASITAPPPAGAREPAAASQPAAGGLRAQAGDRLVISGHHLGEMERDAEILEARGAGGGVPFLVRWEDTGHVTLLYPGSDARVERLGAHRTS